jgi:two-component system CheB/CheR fusion protein
MPERDPLAAQQRPRDPPAFDSATTPTSLGFCVVGVGASAGGLEACRLFLAALPVNPGLAFILVQHLDPRHDSLLTELLATATAMPVVEAADGMAVAVDHVYIIPPGRYLAFAHGQLQLTAPPSRHADRLPFDFLLNSLAVACGAYAACVILSGGGSDGTAGARAIKAAGGLVIAQDPKEASHAGMPASAIATGAVDFILPAAEIAAALLKSVTAPADHAETAGMADVIALLKSLTPHDFTLYKTGTMERRITRRMNLLSLGSSDVAVYMLRLRDDEDERQQLVNDLLINVTSFFRDPKIFDLLAASTIPELVAAADGSVRLWVAGCSTGEETYSLAMLLLERIGAERASVKLQIFATDIDADAVSVAREGLYPASVEKDVSAARLAAFFVREEHGYRVSPALRACVVFAVQDVLSDPPFSKLNMVSCRNLLIYLRPEAQAKIIAVFNFALRKGGFLLLGAAETVSTPDPRFEQVSKPARLYRKLGRTEADHLLIETAGADFLRLLPRPAAARAKPADVGEICRKLMLEQYGPAALLVNARLECLYTFGPTDIFLRAASGPATLDVLAQLPVSLRNRMRDAVQRAAAASGVIRLEGGRVTRDGKTRLFDVEIQKLPGDEDKFLLCFLNQWKPEALKARSATADRGARIAELEGELAATRSALQQAVTELESTAEEQNAINEEALSVNEEFQSTNEELLTSKEELQSLNEELTALNSQLQESLERSRMNSTDLRNVLYSTDVPTLFLDAYLKIRFFTPSATLLFHIIQSDVGRKLEDFRSLAGDSALLLDAARVIVTAQSIECEIQAENGNWYQRRVQPYRTYDGAVAGVVITFTDITDRKQAAAALEAARLESERANLAKSRFLAAASHDLRQPLQTMALINGMLAKSVVDAESRMLVSRLDNTMQSIGIMLDAMLDINQIEAGIVRADIISVLANDLLIRLYDKFKDQAAAQGTALRMVRCSASIATDPALLEQMLSNLIGNALKYTKGGRVLFGCRRHGGTLGIEVWDTGIGIPADQLRNIFDEYHQLDNAARERSLGLGLGLSIVQRLGALLGHKISVRSRPGKGSGFSVTVDRARAPPLVPIAYEAHAPVRVPPGRRILVIEDDPDISQLLASLLTEEGFVITIAHDGKSAAACVADGLIVPDLILADYNLPGGETGLKAANDLRARLNRKLPVIIVTGDISAVTLRLIADEDCVQINKPMKLGSLMETIARLLTTAPVELLNIPGPKTKLAKRPNIYIVDDDSDIRAALRAIFEEADMNVDTFPDAESFLAALPAALDDDCLLVDAGLPGLSGLQLLQKLAADAVALPAIMVIGKGDVAMAVQAMKAGAADFLEKPAKAEELLACVRQVLAQKHGGQALASRKRDAARQIAGLTPRQREVMERVLAGQPSKNIAADLGISQRTVENHRASIMLRTGVKSIPALVRLSVTAKSES